MIDRARTDQLKKEKRQRLRDEDNKRLKKIHNRSQEQNKKNLTANMRAQNKKNKYTISHQALGELERPETVYLLGGMNHGGVVYIHSHTRTYEIGLKMAQISMRRMLQSLVDEQKSVIANRIAQIDAMWQSVFDTIIQHEQKMGSNIQIRTWKDFEQYYTNLESPGQVGGLEHILKYKMAMSALNAATDWSFRGGDTVESYTNRLLRLGLISKDESNKILNGNMKASAVIGPVKKILSKFKEAHRKGFIGDASVTNWINTLKENSATRAKYGNAEVQQTFIPSATELGFITEHALVTSKEFNKLIEDLQTTIAEQFAEEIFEVITPKKDAPQQASVSRVSISGETHKNKGGLDNAINKADIASIIDLGDVSINIPSSVKLSMDLKSVKFNNDIVTVTAEDTFSASANAEHINFVKINQNVGSFSYGKDQEKIHALANYVYSNAGVIPLMSNGDLIKFNNSIIYYLAWLKICIEVVGNPNNNSQLAMALESVGSISNTADILRKIVGLTPAKIAKFIEIHSNPLDNITFSGASSAMALQSNIDHTIANLWQAFLSQDGQQPNYQFIYDQVYSILNSYQGITKKPTPPIHLEYRIKLDNIRTLTIPQ